MKVFVTRKIPDNGLELLQKETTVDVSPHDRVLERQELISMAKGSEALLSQLTDTVDAALLDALPDVKIISNYAVGYNNIDVKAATERGVIVTNTPGVLTDTTADLAFTLMLACARRIPESARYARDGKFKGWAPLLLLGREVTGSTLGIIGMGRIGSTLAKRAKGFDMKIIYHDMVRAKPEVEEETGARFVDMDTLLRESDFISIHVPLLPETKHMIGAAEFSKMKKTAILVNTSRGPVIDERALIEALSQKKIFSAGLDVFENEPEIPEELMKLDNCVIVPHIGSATIETREKMAELAAKNIILASRGEMPVSVVNPEVMNKSKLKIKGV